MDITRAGIDKAYGVNKLLARLTLAPDEAVFFGDRLDEGGNDYPVIATGVPCVAVSGWKDTPRQGPGYRPGGVLTHRCRLRRQW